MTKHFWNSSSTTHSFLSLSNSSRFCGRFPRTTELLLCSSNEVYWILKVYREYWRCWPLALGHQPRIGGPLDTGGGGGELLGTNPYPPFPWALLASLLPLVLVFSVNRELFHFESVLSGLERYSTYSSGAGTSHTRANDGECPCCRPLLVEKRCHSSTTRTEKRKCASSLEHSSIFSIAGPWTVEKN